MLLIKWLYRCSKSCWLLSLKSICFEHTPFRCLILDPHLIKWHLNIGVQKNAMLDLGMSTLSEITTYKFMGPY